MKDIKSYIIGFLSCACLFLIMGQTKANAMDDIRTMLTQNGRYQVVANKDMLYIADTRTGELFGRNPNYGNHTPKWINTHTTFLSDEKSMELKEFYRDIEKEMGKKNK